MATHREWIEILEQKMTNMDDFGMALTTLEQRLLNVEEAHEETQRQG